MARPDRANWSCLQEDRGLSGAVSRAVASGLGAPIDESVASDGSPVDGVLRAKVWGRRVRGTSCIDVHVERFSDGTCVRFRVFSGTEPFAAALGMPLGGDVAARFALSGRGVPRCVRLVPLGDDASVPETGRHGVCPVCGSEFDKSRSDAVYCGDSCRSRASYARRRAQAELVNIKAELRKKGE